MKARTLEFKKSACANCKQADKRAMRKGWAYCSADNARVRSGHCTAFNPEKKKHDKG